MIAAQACALIRYTVLARMLGPAQLGVTVTLMITAQFFDAITDSGNDRFLVQDRQGNEPRVQMMVQMVAVMRGVTIALGLLILAVPIAYFYKSPALVPGLMALGLSPLIAGFTHLDLRRKQRAHDFGPEGKVVVASEVISLIATVIAAYLLHSFTAIIIGLVARSVTMVIVSRMVAERPYAIGFAPEHARRMWAFGAPLILNGLLLYFGSQSDRVVVGKHLGLFELGRYSSVLLLIFYPTGILQRFVSGMYMPLVAAERNGEPGGEAAIARFGGVILLMSLAMSFGFALVAPTATVVLFGRKFAHSFLVVGLIGVLQTSRFMRIWPVTIALGVGRSSIVLANNLARLGGMPVGIACAFLFGTLQSIIAGFIVGEIFALILGMLLVNRAIGAPRFADFGRIGLFVLGSGAVLAGAQAVEARSAAFALLALVAGIPVVVMLFTRERAVITELYQRVLLMLRRRTA